MNLRMRRWDFLEAWHLRGAHALGVDGAIAVLVEHLQRGLYLVGEGRDGDGALRTSAEHGLELFHVEDSVAVGVDIREHGLDVLGEGADVDPPSSERRASSPELPLAPEM